MKDLLATISHKRSLRQRWQFRRGKRAGSVKSSTEYGTIHIFGTPWQGEPWVNIQNLKGEVKSYQVTQVLDAIDKLERSNDG